MLTNAKLKESLENLPEKFTIDELIERLIFIEKVERGNQQSEQRERFRNKNWTLKSNGHPRLGSLGL